MALKPLPSKSGKTARRGGGPKALAVSLGKVTAQAMDRKSLGIAGLLAEWPQVVGPEFAEIATPLRLTRGGRAPAGGTLTLSVAPGQALALQHLEPLLIERINGYLGYGAVSRLKLVQGRYRPAPKRRPLAARNLSPEAESRLKAHLANVDDEGLRAALERLGRAVLVRDQQAADD